MSICLVLVHAEAEGPYAIRDSLEAAGVEVRSCSTFRGERPPSSLRGIGALVVMGGPMSAASDDAFPTRVAELTLISDAIEAGLPILGVCLGAQLLALAGGGTVFSGSAGPEIGWGSLRVADAASSDPLFRGVRGELEVLHWHGDSYSRPPDGVLLASSPLYPEQAFRLGARAWGLQFHLEVDLEAVDAFVGAFGTEARAAGVEPGAIRARAESALAALGPVRDRILQRFSGLAATSPTAEDVGLDLDLRA